MFASAFFGNLASMGMPAGCHHLYEYGTCGVFAALGRPTTEPGSPIERAGPAPHDGAAGPSTSARRTASVSWFGLKHFNQILEDPVGGRARAGWSGPWPTPGVPRAPAAEACRRSGRRGSGIGRNPVDGASVP